MTILEAMRADAAACNARHRAEFGAASCDQPRAIGPNQIRAQARRKKVAAMMHEGMPLIRIAEALGANYETVKYDAYAIRRAAQ